MGRETEQRVGQRPHFVPSPFVRYLQFLRLRDVDGGFGVAVEGEGVGAVAEEEGAHFAAPLGGGLVQRRKLRH